MEEKSGKLQLTPAWMSRDMDHAEPPVIANGVVFAYGSGENTTQAYPDRGLTDFSPLRIKASTHATLYALDAETGKELYSSGDRSLPSRTSADCPSPMGAFISARSTACCIASVSRHNETLNKILLCHGDVVGLRLDCAQPEPRRKLAHLRRRRAAQRLGRRRREHHEDSVKDLQLLWKVKLETQSRGMRPVMPPVIQGRLISYRGFKELAFVATNSDIVYAIDADVGTIFWQKHLEYSTREPQVKTSSSACPGGLTAMPTMPIPARGAAARGGPASAAAQRGSAFIGGPASVYALSSEAGFTG